jgi:hypothetical protein
MDSTTSAFDTFLCVHRRDVDYLLNIVLRSYHVNFLPKGKLFLVTNDLAYLQEFIDQQKLDCETILFSDNDWLSKQEQELPGWYRQQIIKLRAFEFCTTENFCNLGSDTVLLQPICVDDLVEGGFPILYYTPHLLPDTHWRYEQDRVRNVAKILKVNPVRSARYGDFINDLFCFNREALVGFNELLCTLYGPQPFVTLLRDLKMSPADQNKFGEWTLYSVYLLDVLNREVPLRSTTKGFLYQVHSWYWLPLYRFDTKVVHFVAKDFNVSYIKRRLRDRGLELANHL